MTTDRNEILQAVSSAVLAVTRHLSVREVLQVIVRSAQRLLDARYAALGVPDEDGSFAEFVAEGLTDKQWDAIGPLPRQHGMLGAMLRDGTPARLPDLRKDPRFEWWPKAHPVMKDFLGVPIRDGEQVLGIIFLANKRRPGGFTQEDQDLLTLFAAHAAIALANARLYERGRELAMLEERNRVARELHDAVTQKLFSLRLTAQAAGVMLDKAPDKAAVEIERVQRLAGEALAELRAVIVELRPAELDRHGLSETLRKHVRMLDRLHPSLVTFECAELPPLESAVEVAVLRVAQEALHNALRHSEARSVTVRLAFEDGKLALTVRDDGIGFEQAESRGLGLVSMRDRAESVGGVMTVESVRGGGTTVRVEVGV
ncbi:Histidine kinase-, DNA gyrase B-, and HSP90-like ATPase [Nonomuraea solani]|uniref:Oxygen sensor histidine kinase NreB n=1 Tax=Nonomuraea solani TaxID=1144553 RepID=A0A1H6CQE3_9ACTN|nr:GAF domain-containing sensor histidine kinase [Nonomuraea solani]SEG74963.1 Histidine kinase-, DNA gyrase B-, and HSP90-like ATPase [Nonomuraea solani]